MSCDNFFTLTILGKNAIFVMILRFLARFWSRPVYTIVHGVPSSCEKHKRAQIAHFYLPTQNFENIAFTISSVAVLPVICPKAS